MILVSNLIAKYKTINFVNIWFYQLSTTFSYQSNITMMYFKMVHDFELCAQHEIKSSSIAAKCFH